MTILGLAGDTMLGRKVAEVLEVEPPAALFAPEVLEIATRADLLILNLECCISERGERWPAPGKPFFFRAPPAATEALALLGVDCVTLANNHALDYGPTALLDTFDALDRAGIAYVGAGPDLEHARAPQILETDDIRVTVLGVTDHPRDFAATPSQPGVAWAPLDHSVPDWLLRSIGAADTDAVVVSPHWGPNMVADPRRYVRRAARVLLDGGATLIAGHSAHVVHGIEGHALFDLGDFVDDYATDPVLRNDLGLFFLVELIGGRPTRLEAFPLKLDYCHTRLAHDDDAAWMQQRFRTACAQLGTPSTVEDGRIVVTWDATPG